MRYLQRPVTPDGGVTPDPFMGSGTSGCAAVLEGLRFIAIELDTTAGYFEIAQPRIAHWARTAETESAVADAA
jgi:site-specific DNA-methyltransferase (adenine-specific)